MVKDTQKKEQNVWDLFLGSLKKLVDGNPVHFASPVTVTVNAELRSLGKRATDCTELGARLTGTSWA